MPSGTSERSEAFAGPASISATDGALACPASRAAKAQPAGPAPTTTKSTVRLAARSIMSIFAISFPSRDEAPSVRRFRLAFGLCLGNRGLAQRATQNLADRRARQRVAKLHVARRLVRGEPLQAVGDELGLGQRRVLA